MDKVANIFVCLWITIVILSAAALLCHDEFRRTCSVVDGEHVFVVIYRTISHLKHDRTADTKGSLGESVVKREKEREERRS